MAIIYFFSERIYSFPTQDDESVGFQALHFHKMNRFWLRGDLAATDAFTKTSPPNSKYIDRKIQTFMMLGGEIMGSGRWGGRANIKSTWLQHKGKEDTAPKSPKNRKLTKIMPSLHMTYITPKDLEVFFGIQGLSLADESITIDSPVATSNISYESFSLFSYSIGFMKRGNRWNGGIYYDFGSSGSRSYTQKSSDGSTRSGKSEVIIPSKYGVVADFPISNNIVEFDVASIHAGEGGERTASGGTVRDDYLRVMIACLLPLDSSWGLKFSFAHQTLSYSDNAYANIESIPINSLRILGILGDQDYHKFIGLILAQGEDGTDITEYKARFSLGAVALTFGLFHPI